MGIGLPGVRKTSVADIAAEHLGSAPGSSEDPVAQVCFARVGGCFEPFKLHVLPQTSEQRDAVAEQYRGDVKVKLIDESESQALS